MRGLVSYTCILHQVTRCSSSGEKPTTCRTVAHVGTLSTCPGGAPSTRRPQIWQSINQRPYSTLQMARYWFRAYQCSALSICLQMAHSRHGTLSNNRPCFDGRDRLANGRVFFDINGTVDGSVPDRRFIRPIDHVDLDFNCSREDGVSAILCDGFQSVRLPLGTRYEG